MGEYEGSLDGTGLRFAIAVSRFNSLIGEHLLSGAREAFHRHNVTPEMIDVVRVPGAFELPLIARWLAETDRYHAVVCLGAVIRGETAHFDYVAGQSAAGIAAVAQSTGVPVMFGVLTTDTAEQALDRAGGKVGNKGSDAALAAIEMATLRRTLTS